MTAKVTQDTTLSEEILGKPTIKRRWKQGHYKRLKHLGPTVIANIEHSPSSNQIDRNPHTKGLFTSGSIPWYNISCFQQKIKSVPKGEEKQPEEAKQELEPDSDMTQMLEWSHRE